MKPPVKSFFAKYFNPGLDLQVQAFNLLAFAGIAAGLIVAVISAFQKAGAPSVVFNLLASALAVVLFQIAGKKLSYRVCSWIVVIVVFMLVFPVLFFSAGGYRSGMPSFFMLAMLFTAILLEKRGRIFAVAAEFALYVGCCLVAYNYHGLVASFKSEGYFVSDVITGIIVGGLILNTVVLLCMRFYGNHRKKLTELDKLKTGFLQNISHELRTPLTIIINCAIDTMRELGREQLNVPEMELDQSIIRDEGERLKRMVSQLLDVTAIESGSVRMRFEPLSLAALLSRIADAGPGALNGKERQIELRLPGGPPEGLPDVLADQDAIQRVLLNLLSNAFRHAGCGLITVSLSSDDGWQTVCVHDDGEGMKPEVRNQVFLRYIERESTVTGRSGMGLYICKKLIDAHSGEIGISSEPGQGTSVWFKLPEANGGGKQTCN